jgi:hypothetical protein
VRYLRANPTQRRFLNQALFKAIWVSHEDIERAELESPFAETFAAVEAARAAEQTAMHRVREVKARGEVGVERESSRPLAGSGALARGSIRTSKVELVGLEPTTFALPARRSPS